MLYLLGLWNSRAPARPFRRHFLREQCLDCKLPSEWEIMPVTTFLFLRAEEIIFFYFVLLMSGEFKEVEALFYPSKPRLN